MLSRLKTLPLTIVLTILIWMYAESQQSTLDYSTTRDDRITNTSTQGCGAEHRLKRATINDLPVWVSGPPDAVARYQIELYPRVLKSLVVSGSPAAIQALLQRMAPRSGGESTVDPTASQILAYLDITSDDRPSQNRVTRPLRYTLPEGLTLQQYPSDIDFRLIDRPSPTQPANP